MTIIYYFENEDSQAEAYKDAALSLPDDINTRFFSEFSAFMDYLEVPKHERDIAVVNIADEVRLMELISRYQAFWNIRFIVLIPENHEDLVRKVHLLHPRFIGYSEMDCKEITSVILRMVLPYNGSAKQHNYGRHPGTHGTSRSTSIQAGK